eukprot:CAMPEP_0172037888 /NCGR_PEP_ID=MMETSP1041-20130122/23005_1 /TAXON_ID=464988 /ORGANISM="Hemiselmis andersenii, Strain CCMP439" /LENGTH=78 /DNA_ID=CAMNT_0012695349 /DNA_START=23 /DNA_END=256 /DNA_ORIENTATION=+
MYSHRVTPISSPPSAISRPGSGSFPSSSNHAHPAKTTLGLSVVEDPVSGARVTNIAWGGPAHLSGAISKGDVVVAVDG